MTFLVDTNVLLRLVSPQSSQHLAARRSVETLRERGQLLAAAPQNFIEAWNVATRPIERNGLGFGPSKANRIIAALEGTFFRLPEPGDVYERWRTLVVDFNVAGVQVHDARLVAVLLANEISDILTFNGSDFHRYSTLGIRATSPEAIGKS